MNRKKLGGERSGEKGGCGRVGIECFEKNCLTTMLCEQAHYHDGGASFLQSTFQVAFFVLHPTDVSEPLDKNLDYLTFRREFMLHKALMIKETSSIAFTSE
jgi:hypothetical protein